MFVTGQLNRPKIFDQWPKTQPRSMPVAPVQPNRGSKSNQSIRAEQALHKSLMLITNIKNFLDKKIQIKKNCDQLMKKSILHKIQLEELIRSNNNFYNIEKHKEELKKYYIHIRKQTSYLQFVEYFVLSNLPNYDNKVSKLRQQITNQEAAHAQLQKKLEEIEAVRKVLQQSLTMYQLPQSQRPQSIILSNTSYYPEYNFQLALQLMLKQISEQKLIQIHYLMQYKIKIMEKCFRQFNNNIKDDIASYSVYEAIYDSINLMNSQQEEMKKDQLLMGSQFSDLNVASASNIVPSSNNSLNILLKNQKVYDSNYQLLARYNAETNLNQYAQRRKQYAQRLTRFKRALTRWKQEQQIATFLFSKQQIYTGYGKLLKITDRNTNPVNIKNEKQLVNKAYLECLSYPIPEKMTHLANYRQQITQNMKSLLQNQNISIDRLNSQSPRVQIPLDQNKYRKYLNLFVQLQAIPDKDKAEFLFRQKSNIQAMKYQLAQINPQTDISNSYIFYLNYCQAIAQHIKTNDDIQYKKRIELNRRNRWTNLPHGLEVLLFHYTIDVYIKMPAEQYLRESFLPIMTDLKSKIETQLAKSYNSLSNPQDKQQFPKKHLSFPPGQRQTFFITFYKKISKFGHIMKKRLMDYYWQIAQNNISYSYQRNIPPNFNFKIEKKDFFKFRILSYLTINGSHLLISNLLELTLYYLDSVQKFTVNSWQQKNIFLQIVKQKMFIRFLRNNKQLNKLKIGSLIYGLQCVNQATILLYETNQYLLSQNIKRWTTDKSNSDQFLEQYLEYGLKINKSWIQLQNLVRNNQLMAQNPQILYKVTKIVQLMKRPPVMIAAKASLSSIQAVVNVKNKFSKLKGISQINTEGSNSTPPYQRQEMKFISGVYVRAINFIEIYQNMNNKFAPSDIVMIRDNNNKFIYLEKIRAIYQPQIASIVDNFNVILRIFRSKTGDRINYPKDFQLMITIITKLLKLRSQQQ